jgi:GT2 family glycosyltransferase
LAHGEKLGVVVIGRNEGERLRRCLASVRPHARLVVYVDSGSTDGSVEVARSFGADVVALDLSIPLTAARARNEGVRALAARTPEIKWVQFIDGDCELVQEWLPAALAFISARAEVAVVCGRRREQHPDASIYNRLCDLEWNTPIGKAQACGGDSLVRMEAFEAVGGFRAQLIAGEEPELCVRLREAGWKIWRFDGEMTRHDAGIARFTQWWKRNVRGGYGYAQGARLTTALSGIWQRQLVRAVLWGAALPLAIIAGTFLHPLALAGAVLYPAQIARIAIRRGASTRQSWVYAFFITISKFAEMQGVAKHTLERLRGRTGTLIEYKGKDIDQVAK